MTAAATDLSAADLADARRALACLDLTDLADDASEAGAERLCARAATPFGPVAASGRTEGEAVLVAIRQSDLEIGAGGASVDVLAAQIASDGLHVQCAMPGGGPALDAVFDASAAVRPGDALPVRLKSGRGCVFGDTAAPAS